MARHDEAVVVMAAGGNTVVLAHSSDLHVDDPLMPGDYTGLVGLRAVLAAAAAARADLMLLAGDTFDNLRVSMPVLRQAAALLAASTVPVVLLPGNHDPLLDDHPFARGDIGGEAHVHVLGLTHPDAIAFDELGLEIWGHAHRDFSDMDPLRTPRERTARWQVAMAHGHYVPPQEWAAQAHRAWRISDASLAATGADYVALGHWDRPTPVGDGSVAAYYSGSPDMAGTINIVRLSDVGVAVQRVGLLLRG